MVTEPLKPFLDKTISSANLHAYVYQTDRGEVVIGGGVDPYPSYSQRSTRWRSWPPTPWRCFPA